MRASVRLVSQPSPALLHTEWRGARNGQSLTIPGKPRDRRCFILSLNQPAPPDVCPCDRSRFSSMNTLTQLPPTESRRDFFRRSLRRTALSAVGVLGASLGYRRLRDPERCLNQGLCRGCEAFAGCGLPQALSARQVLSPTQQERSQSS